MNDVTAQEAQEIETKAAELRDKMIAEFRGDIDQAMLSLAFKAVTNAFHRRMLEERAIEKQAKYDRLAKDYEDLKRRMG